MRRYSQGFTIIELLVVVAIIGILSAVGVVSYSGYKTSAEKKQAEISLNSIYLAEQEYRTNNGNYYYNSSISNIVNDDYTKFNKWFNLCSRCCNIFLAYTNLFLWKIFKNQ